MEIVEVRHINYVGFKNVGRYNKPLEGMSHLSKLSGMMEYEMILVRTGLFDVPTHR